MKIEDVIKVFGNLNPTRQNIPNGINKNNGGTVILILGILTLVGFIYYHNKKQQKDLYK